MRSTSIGCESGSRPVVEGGKDVVDNQVLESEIMNMSRVPAERLLRLDSHEPLQLLAIKDADGLPQVRVQWLYHVALTLAQTVRVDWFSRLKIRSKISVGTLSSWVLVVVVVVLAVRVLMAWSGYDGVGKEDCEEMR